MIKRFCDICDDEALENEHHFRYGEIGFTHLCQKHHWEIAKYVIDLRKTEGIWRKEILEK